MKKLRKIEDELEARTCLAEAARSGLGAGAWARSQGIDGRSLHAWKLNLSRGSKGERRSRGRAKRAKEPAKSGLVEIVPVVTEQREGRYVIHVGRVSMEFGDDFREETLRRALEVLQSC